MVKNRMNVKEKIISYGKQHPKDKNMVIALLAVIIFAENVKKAVQSGVRKQKKVKLTELTGVEDMYKYDEHGKGYYTTIRNVEYNSDHVKKQLKPFNCVALVPVALICVTALGMAVFTGSMNPSAKAGDKEEQINLLEEEKSDTALVEAGDMEPAVVTKTEAAQTAASIQEPVMIDNALLPWNLILINDDYSVPQDYEVELVYVEGKQVDSRIADDLKEMLKAAKAAGMNCKICSAYRTSEKQESLVKKDVAKYKAKGYNEEEALELTYQGVSPVDHSEHQTGLTVDIVSASHQSLDAAHAETKEAIWLKDHCMEYGFIVRYMEGKEDITHRKAESWHFRYVGAEAAAYIMENNITLEEYLEEYITNN